MLLADKVNIIREVFISNEPKMLIDLMMQAPSEVDEAMLKELNIKKDLKKT